MLVEIIPAMGLCLLPLHRFVQTKQAIACLAPDVPSSRCRSAIDSAESLYQSNTVPFGYSVN